VREIVESVKVCLGNAPPELANDVIEQGLNLVGGGGLLPGLDQRIAHDIDVEVRLADNPLECVVLGAGHCIEEPAALRVVFQGDR
jgi:rod shape-determining protein MreB